MTAIAETDPEVRAAVHLIETFEPRGGVDYSWAVREARGLHATVWEKFDLLDAKAARVVNYLGSGTGLLALASTGAAGAGTIDPLVAAASLVPFGFGVAATVYAVKAHRTERVCLPSSVAHTIDQCDHYEGDAIRAEAKMLGYTQLATALLTRAAWEKARRIDMATLLFAIAVGTLAVPVLVSVAMKCLSWSTK